MPYSPIKVNLNVLFVVLLPLVLPHLLRPFERVKNIRKQRHVYLTSLLFVILGLVLPAFAIGSVRLGYLDNIVAGPYSGLFILILLGFVGAFILGLIGNNLKSANISGLFTFASVVLLLFAAGISSQTDNPIDAFILLWFVVYFVFPMVGMMSYVQAYYRSENKNKRK